MIAETRRLLAAALPERRSQALGVVALGIVSALAEGGGLLLLGVVINVLAPTDGTRPLLPLGGIGLEAALVVYTLLAVLAAATVWARTIVVTRLRLEAVDRLRRSAFGAVLRMEWPTLRGLSGPHTTQLLVNEAARVGNGIDLLMQAIGIAVRLPVLVAVAFVLSPVLATGTLAVVGIAAAVAWRYDRAGRLGGFRMLAANRTLSALATDTLLGRRVVKALGLERDRLRTFDAAIVDVRAAQLAQQRAFATTQALLNTAVAVAVGVGLWVAVRAVGMRVADALVLALTFGRLGESALRLRGTAQVIVAAAPAEAAIRALLASARAAAEPEAMPVIAPPHDAIVLDRVSVTFDDGTVALSDVSATIPVRRITVVVGPSGSGKSTLADLVMGLGVPTGGEVRLDGHALDAGGRRSWRRQVGYVPQDAFLFHESIRANLCAARPEADEAALWAALEDADVADAVRALPDGLDTIVGERGDRLSGGERQRVALARALVRGAALLVLDEPTSALDAESEARIATTLERLRSRYTILIVAHRTALSARADTTITLARGRRTTAAPSSDRVSDEGERRR